jgi:Plant protein of unknown function
VRSYGLTTDLILLENQLPFFVVHILWDIISETVFDHISFKDVALSYFDIFYPKRIRSRVTSEFDCQHLLDLLYWSRIHTNNFKERTNYSHPSLLYFYSDRDSSFLSNARKERTSKCFIDIQFREFSEKKIVISIPEIHLYACNCRIFQNLIAFVQAYRVMGL